MTSHTKHRVSRRLMIAALFTITACTPEGQPPTEIYERSACCGMPLPGPLTFSGSVSAKGSVASSVVKGTYVRGDETLTTSNAALKSAQDHAKHYEGPAKYDVSYSIVLKADKSVDTTMSTVTFKKVSFTHGGTLTTSMFETVAIPITGVTLGPCDVLESFTFKGDKWYKNIPGSVEDKGIEGSVNVKTTATTYTAKYSSKSNGAAYTYTATSEAPKKKCPEPEIKCCEHDFGDELDVIPCAIPLPEPCEEDPPAEDPEPGPPGDHDIYQPMDPDPELPE